MSYDCWRGMVGIIKPTKGSGSLVELITMLPDGIGVIPLFNNVRHGDFNPVSSVPCPAHTPPVSGRRQRPRCCPVNQRLDDKRGLRPSAGPRCYAASCHRSNFARSVFSRYIRT